MKTREDILNSIRYNSATCDKRQSDLLDRILEVLLDIRDLAVENQKTRFVTYHKDEPDEEGQGAV